MILYNKSWKSKIPRIAWQNYLWNNLQIYWIIWEKFLVAIYNMLFGNLPFLLIEWVLAQSFIFLLILKPYKHKLLSQQFLRRTAHSWRSSPLSQFPPLSGNQTDTAVITLHKHNRAEPLELNRKVPELMIQLWGSLSTSNPVM